MNSSLIKYIKIPKISDECFLCFAQTPEQIPFEIKRVYYILKAIQDLPRGFHAHYQTEQVLFCIQGSITMVLDNGRQKEEIVLDRPEVGIMLDKMVWHEMHNFQPETIILVLASDRYKEEDYIRNYEEFLRIVKE